MILGIEFMLYRIPQPHVSHPANHPFETGPFPIAELNAAVNTDGVSRHALWSRWIAGDYVQVELHNIQPAADDWCAGHVSLFYNEKYMRPVPFMLYTLPSAVPSFAFFHPTGMGAFSLGMRVFHDTPPLPRRTTETRTESDGFVIVQSSVPALPSPAVALDLISDDVAREGGS